MPPFPERESSILAKLKKKKGPNTVTDLEETKKERNSDVNGGTEATLVNASSLVSWCFLNYPVLSVTFKRGCVSVAMCCFRILTVQIKANVISVFPPPKCLYLILAFFPSTQGVPKVIAVLWWSSFVITCISVPIFGGSF